MTQLAAKEGGRAASERGPEAPTTLPPSLSQLDIAVPYSCWDEFGRPS